MQDYATTFSSVISRFNVMLKTNVSETAQSPSSESIIDPEYGERSGLRNVGFSLTLTRLIVRENFAAFISRENFALCKTVIVSAVLYRCKVCLSF
jgi:hypothetical protein